MSEVFWKRQKLDSEGVVWNDLIDLSAARRTLGAKWVVTYRDYSPSNWHVMWNSPSRPEHTDELIAKTVTEDELRDNLRLRYILLRGES